MPGPVEREAGLERRLEPPPAVRRIAEELERHGYETWCVGGAVRDALLGIAHLDWDLATAATPQQVRRIFRRTIPVGIEFGTVGVLDEHGLLHEVTTFRRDVRTDGRHAEVEFGASLDEDLARRDLTINAIAYSPSRRALHDPFGGRADLEVGVVRAVGDAEARMREDRLRALRAIRFAARFGFTIEPATWRAIVASSAHLGRLSAERVKQELDKTAEQVPRSGSAIALWREAGALGALVPALAALSDLTVGALDLLPPARGRRAAERRVVWYAALLAGVPAGGLPQLLRALRFSNVEARAVARLVELWQTLGPELGAGLAGGGAPSDVEVRRWVARAGRTEVGALLRLARAYWCATRDAGGEAPSPSAVRAAHRRLSRAAWRDPVAIADLAVGGDDLKRVGVAPGPEMARILHGLLDAVLEEPSRNTVSYLLEHARRLAAVPARAAGEDNQRDPS